MQEDSVYYSPSKEESDAVAKSRDGNIDDLRLRRESMRQSQIRKDAIHEFPMEKKDIQVSFPQTNLTSSTRRETRVFERENIDLNRVQKYESVDVVKKNKKFCNSLINDGSARSSGKRLRKPPMTNYSIHFHGSKWLDNALDQGVRRKVLK